MAKSRPGMAETWGEAGWRRLPTVTTVVDADHRLVLQVLGAVVTQDHGALAGHAYECIERESRSAALVRFDLRVLGRRLSTVERVVLEGPAVSFIQVSGYLPAAEEVIRVDEAARRSAVLTYTGRYQPRPGPLGRIFGAALVPAIYRREARRTLGGLKQLAEARQARSALFREPEP